ncbi:hypothetical protein AXF42_Ash008637 [Apostasia shenzhenica]|uniref:Uncharacterized protein n=1 Tax=Apostasia shenzhenica TaxID=1088818 RepID=A0A2I0B1Y9_9ASPA|nr:hypothetical protein AXF42_Ash008637 [Apostasia shenzhenica]
MVEVDVTQYYFNKIFISLESKTGFRQPIKFDKFPLYYTHCSKLDHSTELCYI